jgi:hypothetical protein
VEAFAFDQYVLQEPAECLVFWRDKFLALSDEFPKQLSYLNKYVVE